MKTLNPVSAVCVAILLVAPAFVLAQDFRSPYGGSGTTANQSRSFFGLPIPQQWSGNRPASMNQYSGSGACRSQSSNSQYSAQFANGQCATGRCGSGRCSCGQSAGGNCPNGQCRLNQNPDAGYNSGPNYGAEGEWSPRTTRSNSADPFRQAESRNENENWTQRPALRNPVNDLYPSRYNQSDLDLRRPYFNNQSGEVKNSRSGDRSSAAHNTRAPFPTNRSMSGVPADRAYGLAQI